MAYCLTSLAGSCAALVPADAYAALPEASHTFLLGPRRHSRHLDEVDVANQDAGDDHRFYRTSSNPLLPAAMKEEPAGGGLSSQSAAYGGC